MTESAVTRYEERYADNHYLRALVQLVVPFGGAYNTAIQGRVAEVREARSVRLFDRIEANRLPLTKELVESEDFIHRFLVTHEAVLRTLREEKRDAMADLLVGSVDSPVIQDADDYEFVLSLLDGLSYVDLCILVAIQEVEEKVLHPVVPEGASRSEVREMWDEWVRKCRKEIVEAVRNVPMLNEAEIRPRFERLEGMGMTSPILNAEGIVYTAGELDPALTSLDSGRFVFLTGLYARMQGLIGAGRVGLHSSDSGEK